MNNLIENPQLQLSLHKVVELVYFSGHPARTEGEIRQRVNRALGPAAPKPSPMIESVFDNPDISVEAPLIPAIDLEIESARENFDKLSKPAEKLSDSMTRAANFGGLNLEALTKLATVKSAVVHPDNMTNNARAVFNLVKQDAERGAQMLAEIQETFVTNLRSHLGNTPADLGVMLEPLAAKAPEPRDAAIPPKAGGPELMAYLAMQDYLPTTLRHPPADAAARAVYSQNNGVLTTNKASVTPDPADGIDDIRALDTYFVLAFPESTLNYGDQRALTIMHYAVAQEPTLRQQLERAAADLAPLTPKDPSDEAAMAAWKQAVDQKLAPAMVKTAEPSLTR